MRLVFFAFLLIALAACQAGNPVALPQAAFFELAEADVVSLEALHGPRPDTDGPHHLSPATRESVVHADQALVDAFHSTEDWQGADRKVRAFLADQHSDPTIQTWREITVASAFLPGHLVNSDELTLAKQEAIAFYTTLLIENRQLGGTKVSNALDRLEGYWPAAKLAEARHLVDAAALRATAVR